MNWIVQNIKYKIQHYNPKKYWKYREDIVNKRNCKIIRIYKLIQIKKMDAFNNASMGTNLDDICASFLMPPIFPHGLNGIIINKYSKIGSGVTIYHQVTIGSKDTITAPTIGNNVIIYPGAKIIGNIKIGDNVIIGSGSVVVKDISSNCIVAGVPAKIIKERFNE